METRIKHLPQETEDSPPLEAIFADKINELVDAVNLCLAWLPQSAIALEPVQDLHGQGDGDPESIPDNSKEGQ